MQDNKGQDETDNIKTKLVWRKIRALKQIIFSSVKRFEYVAGE